MTRRVALVAIIAGAVVAGVSTLLPWLPSLDPQSFADPEPLRFVDEDLWEGGDNVAAVIVALGGAAVLLALAALATGARTLDALAALAAVGTAANVPAHAGVFELERSGPRVGVIGAFVLVAGAVVVLAPEGAPPRRTLPVALGVALLVALGLTLVADAVVHPEIQVIR